MHNQILVPLNISRDEAMQELLRQRNDLEKKLEVATDALQEIAFPTRPVHYDLYQSVPIQGDDEIARNALEKIKRNFYNE